MPHLLLAITISDRQTVQACNCEVRKFNASYYAQYNADHVRNLQNYAWKPLILQVNTFVIIFFVPFYFYTLNKTHQK